MKEVVEKNFVQPVIENFSSHEVEVVVENPESVSTEESRKANTGDIVKFQRWEGSAAIYLEDPNSAETEITVPSDAESDELTLQAVYE